MDTKNIFKFREISCLFVADFNFYVSFDDLFFLRLSFI